MRRLLLRGQRVAALLPGCRTICHACCDCLLVDRGFIEERATDRRACPPLLIVAAHNELRGTVPPTWVDMTSLKVLDVSGNCGICGNLPFSSNVAVRVTLGQGVGEGVLLVGFIGMLVDSCGQSSQMRVDLSFSLEALETPPPSRVSERI